MLLLAPSAWIRQDNCVTPSQKASAPLWIRGPNYPGCHGPESGSPQLLPQGSSCERRGLPAYSIGSPVQRDAMERLGQTTVLEIHHLLMCNRQDVIAVMQAAATFRPILLWVLSAGLSAPESILSAFRAHFPEGRQTRRSGEIGKIHDFSRVPLRFHNHRAEISVRTEVASKPPYYLVV